MLRTYFIAEALTAIALAASATAGAQDYPQKTIRIVAPPAGGGGDFVARMVAQALSPAVGQPVIVDNRTPFLAAEAVAKAAPDGYTLLVGGGGIWITALLRPMPYDMTNDFAPITMITREANVLVVHPSLPARSVRELIALAKARPGELNFGSSGPGSLLHLGAELFKSMAGVRVEHIAYKGAGQAVSALIGGETHFMITDVATVSAHVKSGRLRALAVTTLQPGRRVALPAVAADLPGYEVVGVTGMWATARTPPAAVARLHQEMVRLLRRPEIEERFANAGSEVVANTPEQLGAFVRSNIATMGKVIRDLGIKVE